MALSFIPQMILYGDRFSRDTGAPGHMVGGDGGLASGRPPVTRSSLCLCIGLHLENEIHLATWLTTATKRQQ